MERTERPLALDTVDRDGETRGSLILQDMGVLSISALHLLCTAGVLYMAAVLRKLLDPDRYARAALSVRLSSLDPNELYTYYIEWNQTPCQNCGK
jgi:hypothetical protein